MSIRVVEFVTGDYYHIYNRGNSKQIIFLDKQDHEYFINLLKIMNTEKRVMSSRSKKDNDILENDEPIISIGAFCLMPNHFHILLKQEKDKGISMYMQKISTAYVMYFNKKYKRTGGLFEGKFKSKYASADDAYLKYLFSYIHLNPLKIINKNWKLSKFDNAQYQFLLQYPYSSFNEYALNKFDYINKKEFPDYFPTSEDFTKEMTSWIKLKESW